MGKIVTGSASQTLNMKMNGNGWMEHLQSSSECLEASNLVDTISLLFFHFFFSPSHFFLSNLDTSLTETPGTTYIFSCRELWLRIDLFLELNFPFHKENFFHFCWRKK